MDIDYPEAYALWSEARRQAGDEQGAIADQQQADVLYNTGNEDE